MYIELLLLIIILFFFTRRSRDADVIYRIREKLDQVLQEAREDPVISNLAPKVKKCKYSLVSHPTRTFVVDKKHIHLLVYNEQNGKSEHFDDNTLLHAALHELAHVLCREVDHSPLFNKISNRLLHLAHRMKLIDRKKPISPDYQLS
jgi:hypothetical protein